MELINNFITYSTEIISSGGLLFGILIIILESFLPALPLGLFVALNTQAFGFVTGIVISWLATCLGCYLSYLFFYYLSNNLIEKHLSPKNRKKLKHGKETFRKIPFSNLVVIITLPFTPAFLINILAGVGEISKKKYFNALLIGKLFMVLFWGYVGKSFIESMTDIKTIITISLMLVGAYILSKLVSKKTNIE